MPAFSVDMTHNGARIFDYKAAAKFLTEEGNRMGVYAIRYDTPESCQFEFHNHRVTMILDSDGITCTSGIPFPDNFSGRVINKFERFATPNTPPPPTVFDLFADE